MKLDWFKTKLVAVDYILIFACIMCLPWLGNRKGLLNNHPSCGITSSNYPEKFSCGIPLRTWKSRGNEGQRPVKQTL